MRVLMLLGCLTRALTICSKQCVGNYTMTDDPVDALLWAVIVTVLLFMVLA